MQAWVKLVHSIVEAEFPSFGIISALSAFSLTGLPVSVMPEARAKLQRLAKAFDKHRLVQQYMDHLPWAVRAYKDAGQQGSHWNAWAAAIQVTRRLLFGQRKHPSDQLAFVLQRGLCFAPTTSPIEQSFAMVAASLGTSRLGAQPIQESRVIGLLLLKPSAEELHELVARARANWSRCFGSKATRTFSSERSDKGVKRKLAGHYSEPAPSGTKPTETQFRRNFHASLEVASAGASSSTTPMRPDGAWGPSHSKEEAFQHSKLSAKFVEANLQGLILPHEQTDVVQQATLEAIQKMAKSFNQRESLASRGVRQLASQLPSDAELQRATVFVESGTSLPSNWLGVLARYESRTVTSLHDASLFVVNNPWSVTDTLVAWASALGGAWLVTPEVLEHGRGAALRRLSALATPRKIWVDNAFREQHPQIWHLILQLVDKYKAKWRFLPSAEAWAHAKAAAIHRARSTEVLALIGGNSANVCERNHVMDASGFLKFITRPAELSSLGMAGM